MKTNINLNILNIKLTSQYNKNLETLGKVSRFNFYFGRGRRIRTLTSGFGDRCATIDTIPLYLKHSYNINTKK